MILKKSHFKFRLKYSEFKIKWNLLYLAPKIIKMEKGNINIQAENIFPIIKKFLYTDQEIFLRELISNAVDATSKLKKLSSIGEYKGDLGELKIEVLIDKPSKTITIKDRGIGMTSQEVKKYINQVAFSGAEEFVKKYKDDDNKSE